MSSQYLNSTRLQIRKQLHKLESETRQVKHLEENMHRRRLWIADLEARERRLASTDNYHDEVHHAALIQHRESMTSLDTALGPIDAVEPSWDPDGT